MTEKERHIEEIVLNALKTEPAEGLSYGLSYRVQRHIFKQKQQDRQKLLYGLLALAAVIIVIGTLIVVKNPTIVNFSHILPNVYYAPIGFGTTVVFLIQLFHHRQLRKKRISAKNFYKLHYVK